MRHQQRSLLRHRLVCTPEGEACDVAWLRRFSLPGEATSTVERMFPALPLRVVERARIVLVATDGRQELSLYMSEVACRDITGELSRTQQRARVTLGRG